MLFAAHYIGLIKLDMKNPSESQVLIPARVSISAHFAKGGGLGDTFFFGFKQSGILDEVNRYRWRVSIGKRCGLDMTSVTVVPFSFGGGGIMSP
ncbi:hypothetical protein [Sulfuricella sp.]|uniref:hypothetical protein n=1 Tax=Sulfuricella sp. TaxID=2099377 RepID=UPI002C932158|nr:hypothetical protein [Sulfuricella sp.]HUX64825.1 hypothetical protein [Sulfuricella sp.]